MIPTYRIRLDPNFGDTEVSVYRVCSTDNLDSLFTFDCILRKSFNQNLKQSLILRLVHHEVKQLRNSQKWPFIKGNMS